MKIIIKNAHNAYKGHNAYMEISEYRNTLFQKEVLRHKVRGIKSKNHNIGTYASNKTSLSCYDDKQYILHDGNDTLAYGHKYILK